MNKMRLQKTHLPVENKAIPGLNFIFSCACRFDSDLSLSTELRVRALDTF